VVKTWHSKFPFDIEQAWDQRLRHYFAERYDNWLNLVDWDYIFNIEKFTKVINGRQYKKWRHTGNAYEFRLSSVSQPNRTMSSYVEGKKKGSWDSCLVWGFWGDIINSPYIALGIYIEDEHDW